MSAPSPECDNPVGGVQVLGSADAVLRQAIENLPDAVTLSAAVRDEQGRAVDMRVEYMNTRARAGYPDADAAVGQLVSELWPDMVENGNFAAGLKVLDTGVPVSGSFHWTDPTSGTTHEFDYQALRLGTDTLEWVLRDSTQKMRTASALTESELLHRTVLSALDEGVILFDSAWNLQMVNDSARKLLGFEEDAVVGDSGPLSLDFVDENGEPVGWDDLAPSLAMSTGEPQVGHVLGLLRRDEMVWLSVNAQPLFREGAADPHAVVASFSDITTQRLTEQALSQQALHDALTGVANRTLLLDRIEHALAHFERRMGDGKKVAVLFFDLDGFKAVNDTLGHAVGDQLLRAVAERLTRTVRSADTVARLGGDEFVVLCDDITTQGLESLRQRAARALSEPVICEGMDGSIHEVVVSASVGSEFGKPRQSAEELLDRADQDMYRAKRERQASLLLSPTPLEPTAAAS